MTNSGEQGYSESDYRSLCNKFPAQLDGFV